MTVESKSEKLAALKEALKQYGTALVAYSGGVDSTFLLKVASDALGPKNVLGVTSKSETLSEEEFRQAMEIAHQQKFNVQVIEYSELAIDGFANNTPQRCYYCKKELFGRLRQLADTKNIAVVMDGCNYEDLDDYRPGINAAQEAGVVSPLKACGLTKPEIRELACEMGLANWNKPSCACLSSRIPYGTAITRERLKMVAEAEKFLAQLGLPQLRVRYHEAIARIEVSPDNLAFLLEPAVREAILYKFRDVGFTYVTLDLQGYRTGSMNETMFVDEYPS
jgi:uncharacterized protein